MMMSARMAAALCLVLLIIGQGEAAPTDGSDNVEGAGDIDSASSDTDSAQQDPLDYGDAGDDQVHSLSAPFNDQGSDAIADADAEYEQLLPHLDADYEDYSSSDDEYDTSDKSEPRSLTRSGNLLLSPLGYRGDGLVSASSGFPENQQKQRITQTLNSAYFQGQSNFPNLHSGQGIAQNLNPAYTSNNINQDYRGKARAAKLLYLLGKLSNAHASSSGRLVGYGQYGHNLQSQAGLSGTLGGRLSYGQTGIRLPVNSNSYGSLGVINAADSGSSSSGSTYDYLSSDRSSYPAYSLGGQSLIKLIRPIARFVAVQQTSPQKHWLAFLNNLNEANISGSGAYQTLYQQINYESQRQERIIRLLKRYREIAAQRSVCSQTGN